MKTLALLLVLVGCDDYLAPPDAPAVDAPRHPDAGLITSDFSISAAPTTVTLATPGTAVVDLTIHRVGHAYTIDLSLQGLPPNITATIDPVTIATDAHAAQLTLTVSAPTTGVVKVDATGFTQHGEAVGNGTYTANISVTGT